MLQNKMTASSIIYFRLWFYIPRGHRMDTNAKKNKNCKQRKSKLVLFVEGKVFAVKAIT